MLTYPDFMDVVVPIVGSPRLAPFDLLLWRAELDLLQQCQAARCSNPALLFDLINDVLGHTPQYLNSRLPRESIDDYVQKTIGGRTKPFHVEDVMLQIRAMMKHDIAAPFGGSQERAAQAIKARLLTVIDRQDSLVTPDPARVLTRLARGELLELDSGCGHGLPRCEMVRIGRAIQQRLDSRSAASGL
jgi:homoserine O-acetyltransferase